MIELSNVNSFYDRSHILHDVSLAVGKAEILSVLGRNGTGKTTLLKTLMGLTDKSTGRISLDGADISRAPTFHRARAGMGYVPQGRQIIPDFSVKENILMGSFARKDGRQTIPDLVPALFPYLTDNLSRPGGLLSGGQQQQLAIARALATEPSVLLLDEPTEGVQPNIVREIEEIILRLNREGGLTIILVEQNIPFARRAGHAFAMLEKGRVAASGKRADLSDDLIHRHLAV